jgi:hypothetical protein
VNDTEDSVERGRGYGPTSAQQVAEGDKREAEILTVVTLLETDGEILESANVSQLDASSDARPTNKDGNRELGGVKYIRQRSSDYQRSTRIEVSPRNGGGLMVSGNEGLRPVLMVCVAGIVVGAVEGFCKVLINIRSCFKLF